MTKNPILNALAATVYIFIVAFVMFYGISHAPGEDTVIIPIAMMSLFTLSAAVMGYLFVYQPLMLYFDGKKKQGINLFLQTLGVFGVITALLLAALFSGFKI